MDRGVGDNAGDSGNKCGDWGRASKGLLCFHISTILCVPIEAYSIVM